MRGKGRKSNWIPAETDFKEGDTFENIDGKLVLASTAKTQEQQTKKDYTSRAELQQTSGSLYNARVQNDSRVQVLLNIYEKNTHCQLGCSPSNPQWDMTNKSREWRRAHALKHLV